MEQIAVYFSDEWVPAVGLSPIVNIVERNWAVRVTNGACKELATGFYIYDFNEYNPDKQYLYLFDWWATLGDWDRYKPWNNDMDSYSYKQSWGRTVAATTPYDDSTTKKKLDNIEKMIGKNQPKVEKIDLSIIEKRLKSIEEKKIEFPKAEKVDLTEVHKKIDIVAKSIKPWITPEQVNEVIQQREDNKAINELVNIHKPQVDAEVNALKQLIEIGRQQRKQELLDNRAIKALLRNNK